ncbi:hypothetical protein C440_04408 [Haloferax mucosum ATCC BAA-1512]|uniref:Uncharacterized protein n=1 Tax=Haloferax mucosum ATCC BAA-1512 TaxID=662479 RepID=M0ING1_9EURY|nr:hypothetical protein [Haloferax mucosum]ELZ96989.1 hypothetical protein C440_04408 [Haloferax mucosum ATCC BAA-1512]
MSPLSTDAASVYTAYLVLLGVTLVAIAMGLFIVFQAYRGYRRNQSQPMLYLAIGFALLTVIPFGISLAGASVGQLLGAQPIVYTYYLPIVGRIVEVCGLGVILYSLSIR